MSTRASGAPSRLPALTLSWALAALVGAASPSTAQEPPAPLYRVGRVDFLTLITSWRRLLDYYETALAHLAVHVGPPARTVE